MASAVDTDSLTPVEVTRRASVGILHAHKHVENGTLTTSDLADCVATFGREVIQYSHLDQHPVVVTGPEQHEGATSGR